jgi:hypothetical protein
VSVAIAVEDTPRDRTVGIDLRPPRLRHPSRWVPTGDGAAAQPFVGARLTAHADRRGMWSCPTMPTDPQAAGRGGTERPTDQEVLEIMATLAPRKFSVVDAAIRVGIVALVLGTAYIHSTLGGLLFTLNAAGYVVAAIAMIAPIALASRFRWVIRAGLIGYAATTIIGWALQGPYYSTAYIAKGIEVALIVLVAVDFFRFDGNPVSLVRRELAGAMAFLRARRAPAAA